MNSLVISNNRFLIRDDWIRILSIILSSSLFVFFTRNILACESFDTAPELPKDVVSSMNKFSTDLYKIIVVKEENCFFSPISIYMTLLLTYTGAAGQTAKEFIQYLHLPESKVELLQSVRVLLDQLKNPKLNTANEIFVEKSYQVKPNYVHAVKTYLYSESPLVVDFKTAYAEAEESINIWVSDKTKQKVNNLIPSGTLDEDTRLVLVNAVHFKDEWFYRFDEFNTRDGDFHISKKNIVPVPVMSETGQFNYLEKDDFKLLQLLYKDRDFSMVILLPKEIEGLKSVEAKLPSLELSSLLDEANVRKVEVKLPKFNLGKSIDLTETLSELGMKHMFTDNADFSEIFEPLEDRIRVSKVLHKAIVEDNEEGTEAAAASAMDSMILCDDCHEPQQIFEFYVDRPFAFFLLFRKLILFSGKVSKPSA